jgi:protocatechuate 3,4-dioxygenase beta subunit
MKIARSLALLLLTTALGFAQQPPEVADAPANPPSSARIADPTEPGTPLVLSGTVVGPDGKPVAGVIVYAYHTDTEGYYNHAGGPGEAQPRLRGWTRTDAGGHFQFTTIKPAPYPNRNVPAHIHVSAWGAGYPRQWFQVEFQGDPMLAQQHFTDNTADYTYVVPLSSDRGGTLHCAATLHLSPTSNFPRNR